MIKGLKPVERSYFSGEKQSSSPTVGVHRTLYSLRKKTSSVVFLNTSKESTKERALS